MNLHNVSASIVAAVNPWVAADLFVSNGYTTAGDGKRTPSYASAAPVLIQDQALTSRDIEHLDKLNIQNVTRKVWISGNVQGLDRDAGKGGDMLQFNGQSWLVGIVFETWDASGWCSVGLSKQTTGP